MTKRQRSKRERYAKAAAACHSGALRDAVSSKWTREKQAGYERRRMGSFGAAGEVRHIDPAEYTVNGSIG